MQEVRLRGTKDGTLTKVTVDGHDVYGLLGYTLRQDVYGVPELELTIKRTPDVKLNCNVKTVDIVERIESLQRYRLSQTYDREYVALDEVLRVLGCQQ